jgi:hypothetical protein
MLSAEPIFSDDDDDVSLIWDIYQLAQGKTLLIEVSRSQHDEPLHQKGEKSRETF